MQFVSKDTTTSERAGAAMPPIFLEFVMGIMLMIAGVILIWGDGSPESLSWVGMFLILAGLFDD